MTDIIKYLIFLALVGLLLLLRFDAHRFGTAEYLDESDQGGLRVWLRRFAWYGLAAALIVAIYKLYDLMYALPITVLHLDLGADRQQAIVVGLAFGIGGTVVAFLYALYRYRRFRLPPARHYPGAAINCIGTAVIDEALFRGIILGLLLDAFGPTVPVWVAIGLQAILYGLAIRLGSRGGSYPMLGLSLVLGVTAGYVTVQTGGIGAAIVGHVIARFALFLATGHSGNLVPAGQEPEDELSGSLPPDGWEIVADPNAPVDVPATSGRIRQVRPS